MATDKFLIGYTDNSSGLQSNLKPWLLTDNAFATLENAYVWRGRVRKRFGSTLMGSSQLQSRLRMLLGTTDGSGHFSATVPGVDFGVGQMFSVGNDTFTVWEKGTPGNMLTPAVSATGTYNTTTGAVVISGEAINTNVWFYPATPVMGLTLYFEPSLDIYLSMGFDTQFSYQFDNTNNNWIRLSAGVSTWTGSDSQFFWMTNYQGALVSTNYFWVTNYNAPDGIRYFDGAVWFKPVLNYTRGDNIGTTNGSGNASGTVPGASGFIGQVFTIGLTYFTVTVANGPLVPSSGGTGTGTFNTATGAYTFTGAFADNAIYFTGNNYIQTSLLIITFRNRLLFFNTVELVDNVSTTYVTRMRYSAIGSPLSPQAWMQDVPGNGGALDAPTIQSIVTAQFIKDRLIVYFEASTFELVYTGNQVQPFQWQKINTELGAIATFSEIPFDKFVIGIDDTGIHACNGANVDRIDQKIPSVVWGFDSETNGDVNRVCGIRDYYLEMAYWTFAFDDRNSSFPYPNKILTYNYANESWGVNDDSFTTLGYYLLQTISGQPPSPGTPVAVWGNITTPWGQNTALWNASGDRTSGTGSTQSASVKSKKVIAGNQQGFVSIINSDVTSNASAFQIDNFVTTGIAGVFTVYCTNHNLSLGDFFALENMNGMTFTDSLGNVLPNPVGVVSSDTINNMTPNSLQATFLDNLLNAVVITGTYVGGGTLSWVSQLDIITKQYNFYTPEDRNIYIPRVDFLVDKTNIGQVIADYFVSSTSLSLVNEGLGTFANPGPLPGSNVLETSPYSPLLAPLEQYQSMLWHPVYFYADGMSVQFELAFGINQMFGYVVTVDPVSMETTISYIALEDFQLHAMLIYAQRTSARLQ